MLLTELHNSNLLVSHYGCYHGDLMFVHKVNSVQFIHLALLL